ncbi:hypothetical protein BGZ95_003285, partial [Linnemannia exigua]
KTSFTMANFTEEQIAYIKTKFDEVDTDNSGSITLDELTTLLKTLGGGELSPSSTTTRTAA